MDGKKKLEQLMAMANGFSSATMSFDEVRSISDAFKALEDENEWLRNILAIADDPDFATDERRCIAIRTMLMETRHEG